MEKWYLLELTYGDEYETELKATNKAEALAEAKQHWSKLTDSEKKHTTDCFATYTTLTEDGIADLDAEQDHISFDLIKGLEIQFEKRLEIQLEAGTSRTGIHGVNYMFCPADRDLYAKIPVPDGASDDYGYFNLKDEITRLASNKGIPAECLRFLYDGQESCLEDDARVPKEMKQISIDNGRNWITPAEALEQMSIDTIAEYMDDDTREAVHRELAPCSDIEFLTRYLELADDDLIIG